MSDKNFMAYGDAETILTEFAEDIKAKEPLVFKGTQAEWDALTEEEQNNFELVCLTDDSETGETVDAVTDGDMRAVTSNAVYDEIKVVRGTCKKPSNISALPYDCRYIQFGKVVVVYIYIKFTSSIAASTDYITGLPKAATNSTTHLSGIDSTDSLRAYIQTNGTSIRNQDQAMSAVGTYAGQLIYICK